MPELIPPRYIARRNQQHHDRRGKAVARVRRQARNIARLARELGAAGQGLYHALRRDRKSLMTLYKEAA